MLRRTRLAVIATLAALGALVLVGATVFIASGVYPAGADRPHTQLVYSLADLTLRRAVRQSASDVELPAAETSLPVRRGAACFVQHCVACHGAPGVAPAAAGRSMQPLPGPLVEAPQRWRERELVWIVRHGIRMTGMPAWQHRLRDADIGALVAFIQRLPDMSTLDYAALARAIAGEDCALDAQLASPAVPPWQQAAAQHAPSSSALQAAIAVGRDHARMREAGLAALRRHACQSCHIIPGVVGPQVHVGPSLARYALSSTIKGRLPNSLDNLVAWIRDPQAIDPGNAMPPMGVGEADARAIAVYLHSLR